MTCMRMPKYLSFVIFLLLCPSSIVTQNLCQGRWRKTFTTSLTIPGHQVALTESTVVECGALCLSTSGCRAFGFCPDQGRCLPYDHLVEYTTRGTAAPGTRYYWLLSPRCPAELGYTVEDAICYRVYNIGANLTTARGMCEQDGGHLMIADTPEKLNLLKPLLYWVGATDQDIEGQWWWINGNSAATGLGALESQLPKKLERGH